MLDKENCLAICLFESIDDQNLCNLTALLESHGADPNAIISKLGIAAIHYAVGFEELEFAEEATKILLKHSGNPNLQSKDDKLTPLHIACIWGREKIVKLLLEHGGNVDLESEENQTPITYAIKEDHFEVIDTIKKFVFEKKLKKKTRKNILQHEFEELKYTPNRINYNFDASSPYYINITHRRHKTSDKPRKIFFPENDDEVEDEYNNQKNLFELTERNVKEFSKQMNTPIVVNKFAITKRNSYIRNWKDSIKQIRRTCSKNDIDYINYLNKCNNVTLMTHYDDNPKLTTDDESFFTAEEMPKVKIKQEKIDDVIEVCEEDYFHSDVENKVMFCERKLFIKREDMTEDSEQSSIYSTQIPPLDYDTDVLRVEFEDLTGLKPIIGKETKKLFLKRLIKLKKSNIKEENHKLIKKGKFSEELHKVVINYGKFEESLNDFLQLETKMSRHFIERSTIKWREGNLKTSFIYFLIDPRISDNLPMMCKTLKKEEVWKRFLNSIFYVGKGKRSRPYQHLYDAIKIFSDDSKLNRRFQNDPKKMSIIEEFRSKLNLKCQKKTQIDHVKESKKIARILDIWNSQMGVVCLHTFNNIIPVEAYTREAAVIDAIGLDCLTNMKRGEYYGVAKNYSMRQKRQLGIALLHRAMNVYIAEGESQLLPFDLI